MSATPEFLVGTASWTDPTLVKSDLAFQMFWSAMSPLRDADKLGLILFQFPPYVTFRPANMDYIARLPERMPGAKIAIEFRHPGWLAGDRERATTLKFLRDHGLAFVAIDTPLEVGLPAILEATTEDVYVRFHGRNRENWFKRDGGAALRFKYLYAERELSEWADRFKQPRGARRAFAIFNNCYSNFGIMNATTKSQMLARKVTDGPR